MRLSCCCSFASDSVIEGIPRDIAPPSRGAAATYCPACKKHVEPVVPNATLGHHMMPSELVPLGPRQRSPTSATSSPLPLHTEITIGGPLAGWQRLAQAPFRGTSEHARA